ncbi:hypothetical protein OG601_47415 [Streptomyces sp. NBC_01239]|uniref:hypothetical protein n=1 Tax=Streptomyces sp. NBC_01239 TaxID=2903792 RepID=UPI002259A9B0|nr:hypothetical protein [Streptomyces sp. NBC_01239]MCX4816757.1 hypothetical protein [Streptomyces sp. NBC_01239]MCX4818205.1 hypothetical protein [Streptomyces sp. NBC_01239]
MSGGSYNYLAEHQPGDLEARRHNIEAMRDRLAEIEANGVPGAARAARLTRYVLIHLDLAEARAQELADVWHAVEWRDSLDWDDDTMRKAFAEWFEKTDPTNA